MANSRLHSHLRGRFTTTWVVLIAWVATASVAFAQNGRPAAVQGTERPFLYRISGEQPSWLYGTIHLPDDRVLAVPASVGRAVDGSDRFFAEIPMDSASQVAMVGKLMLPDAQTLGDVLPGPLYDRLSRRFESSGFPLAPLARLKVWAVALQVVMVDYMIDFSTKQPLDALLYSRARAAGAEVGGLETADEQLALFDSLAIEEQVRMLESTLDVMDEFEAAGRDLVGETVDAYLAGEEATLLELMRESYDPTDELERKIMERVLDNRNVTLTERLVRELQEAPGASQFFAVGAGHVVGPGGMVELLREKGLDVERVGPE
jgi:uncharacterized protein YbaP (TraB family)